ncbi:flagellar basal body P-ring protein FlgI [bacterium]|nr:flagellar basal body P-ring protein FlgI [bacterium]
MSNKIKKIIYAALLSLFFVNLFGSVRIKDIASLKGFRKEQLVGYSLVVGLDGTGDGRRSLVTSHSVRNMLQNFGITITDNRLYTRNVAAVMVTASITPFSKKGSAVDVVVSSLGDASSLEGGTLLMTPLVGNDNKIYAHAQGSVSIGGVNIETIGGERFRKNYALVGRVPNGAVVETEIPVEWGKDGKLELILKEPDFTTVSRISSAIDSAFGNQIASPIDAAAITIQIPQKFSTQAGIVKMIASLESLNVTPDQIARVVINERTGTVVVGKNVKLTAAAVCQGSLTVQISAFPVISQPQPFSQGQTVVVPQTVTNVTEKGGDRIMVLNEPATVSDLAKTLNALQVSARDIISIFQALKEAGSLKAELVIM